MKLTSISKLILFIVFCELAGLIGALFMSPTSFAWYATLLKPALNPPSWIFGPVWTILYILMGVAAFLVWRKGNGKGNGERKALTIFTLQLILNALWSILFFGLLNPMFALLDIILLWLSIIWTMVAFYKVTKPAMYLLIPYILWVSFAVYLNYSIVILNHF